MGSYRGWKFRRHIRSIRRFLKALPPDARPAAFMLLRALRH